MVDIIGFIGVWLLFSFPLYQGFIELAAQKIYFSKLIIDLLETKRLPRILNFFPPIKIFIEKRRVLKASQIQTIDEKTAHKLILYFDKATAWFYVALAGLCNGIYFTVDLGEKYDLSLGIVLMILFSMFVVGILNVLYRLSNRRYVSKLHLLIHEENE